MLTWHRQHELRQHDRRPGILVVDDFGCVRDLLRIVLQHAGFRVWLAQDGPQAVELYKEHASEIDLVVLDLALPVWDGLVTATCLTQINPEVKFCIITGTQSEYTQREILSYGALKVFYKPFPLDKFVASVQELTAELAVAC
ncbi:MAG: response regulator [Gemmataceae bacterium]|nr:response regulator [Gemmataceae bacterium]MCI0737719.1 response regulator [Gemmataceae bacterium]